VLLCAQFQETVNIAVTALCDVLVKTLFCDFNCEIFEHLSRFQASFNLFSVLYSINCHLDISPKRVRLKIEIFLGVYIRNVMNLEAELREI
jgi:hypothetical protein